MMKALLYPVQTYYVLAAYGFAGVVIICMTVQSIWKYRKTAKLFKAIVTDEA